MAHLHTWIFAIYIFIVVKIIYVCTVQYMYILFGVAVVFHLNHFKCISHTLLVISRYSCCVRFNSETRQSHNIKTNYFTQCFRPMYVNAFFPWPSNNRPYKFNVLTEAFINWKKKMKKTKQYFWSGWQEPTAITAITTMKLWKLDNETK